jgi:hypothetical protein
MSYINTDFEYIVKYRSWHTIRPSFLVFLSAAMPLNNEIFGKPKLLQIAEIGSEAGYNAQLMLKAYPDTFLHVIDSYELEQTPDEMLQRTKPFKDRVKFTRKRSIEAAKDYPDNFFDYIYIDAGHDYKSVTEDITAWYPKVKMGGMVSGHDWWFEDVRRAVIDYMHHTPQRLYGVWKHFKESSGQTLISQPEAEAMDWWFTKLEIKRD